jgi:chromate reductase
VLQGKPLAIMGASPGFTGTARAQVQLRQSFTFSGACAVLQPEVLVGRAPEKFNSEGRLVDTTTKDLIRKLLLELANLVRMQRASNVSAQ